MDLSIHNINSITTKDVKEWKKKDGTKRYTATLVFEYRTFGDYLEASGDSEYGNALVTSEIRLFADTLEALQFQVSDITNVVED
tara:strand:+ start:329 stop:580 length:252 start_codon:yes stop_codon:yes gene_type:complete